MECHIGKGAYCIIIAVPCILCRLLVSPKESRRCITSRETVENREGPRISPYLLPPPGMHFCIAQSEHHIKLEYGAPVSIISNTPTRESWGCRVSFRGWFPPSLELLEPHVVTASPSLIPQNQNFAIP